MHMRSTDLGFRKFTTHVGLGEKQHLGRRELFQTGPGDHGKAVGWDLDVSSVKLKIKVRSFSGKPQTKERGHSSQYTPSNLLLYRTALI